MGLMIRPLHAVTLALIALGSQGCFSLLGDVQGGYTSSTRFESGRRGVAVNASLGGNISDDSDTAESVGPGLAVRTKFTSEVKQVSLSPHVYFLPGSGVTPYARLGTNLLQFEHVDGRFAYGMFSPYAELGLYLAPFVVSAFAEYDLRFTSQPNEGFVGLMAGLGYGVSSKTPKDVYHRTFR